VLARSEAQLSPHDDSRGDERAAAPSVSGNAVRPAGAAPVRISARGISKSYGNAVALRDVSLDVAAGEFLTLLGPSGSGKTTLLNIVAGFVRLDAGQLFFGDEDVTLKPVNRRGLGMVFQNYALFPHMTVGENVAFPLRVRKLGKDEIRRRVESVLRLVKLEALAARNVAALSGGQRQRVALARAVVFSPRVVLMDEPLSALDKSLREEMQVEIRHLQKRIGATTMYVTHDQREAMTIGDRVAVMNEGQLVQCGTPPEIYQHPNTAFVARFVGESTLLPVQRRGAALALADGTPLHTTHRIPDGDELYLVLRAERLLLPAESTEKSNRIAITVRDVIYQGDSILMIGETAAGQQVSLRRQLRQGMAGGLPAKDETISVGIDPDSAIIVGP
jgi:putative spermidine/putrescine transport system ATP-binding protein